MRKLGHRHAPMAWFGPQQAAVDGCWRRRAFGWARPWGYSIGTGTPGAATPRSSRSWPATTPMGCGPRAATGGVYVSDELDRLYGEYVWQLCEAGADLATDDLDATCVFVNLDREPRFAPWRPESV